MERRDQPERLRGVDDVPQGDGSRWLELSCEFPPERSAERRRFERDAATRSWVPQLRRRLSEQYERRPRSRGIVRETGAGVLEGRARRHSVQQVSVVALSKQA